MGMMRLSDFLDSHGIEVRFVVLMVVVNNSNVVLYICISDNRDGFRTNNVSNGERINIIIQFMTNLCLF